MLSRRTSERPDSFEIRTVFLCHCGHVETRDQPDRRAKPPPQAGNASSLTAPGAQVLDAEHGPQYGQDRLYRNFPNDINLTARKAYPQPPYSSGSFSFQMIAP
jgi:hypothetical protein